MNDMRMVITKCVELLQTRLTFGAFSFTLLQVTCAFWAIAIIGDFIYNVFSAD